MPDNKYKNVLLFNVKNAKYCTLANPTEIKSIGKSDALKLDADFNEQKIYGDGEVILALPNDKGYTGSLDMVSLFDDFEVSQRRKQPLAIGVADIRQVGEVPINIYVELEGMEVDGTDKGDIDVIKCWLLNVTTSRPSTTVSQKTDSINTNIVSIPLTVYGTPIQASSGETDYIDAKGNRLYATRVICWPDDAGYDTFGDTVPVPKMASA